MSEVKVNKISPRSGTTVTLGDRGDTFTIPSGATINNQGTATNFGATGAASWTTTVKTGDFTAVAGEGYFVDTTSGEVDVTLPAGSPGAVVAVKDYAKTFDTNNCIIITNGSEKIGGSTENGTLATEGIAVTLIYIDSTQGWLITDDGNQSSIDTNPYLVATGGDSVVTCGNFKSHIFTGPGTFTVCRVASAPSDNTVDYLVVAGGGGGGQGASPAYMAGGAGAGGFRMSNDLCMPAPTTSPLATPTGLTVSATAFPITVGAGGAKAGGDTTAGSAGANSIFSTITSAGGGQGGAGTGPDSTGGNGGSGGGGTSGGGGGTGNTPPVSPAQGTNGSTSPPGNTNGGGAGGGAGAAGAFAGPPSVGGQGGVGSFIADTMIGPTAPSFGTPGPVSSTRYFAGGGSGASDGPSNPPSGTTPGGAGGGGAGGKGNPGSGGDAGAGTVNTGGGGGGGSGDGSNLSLAGAGGSGIVIIRYRYQ